jgi:hypothetical protein
MASAASRTNSGIMHPIPGKVRWATPAAHCLEDKVQCRCGGETAIRRDGVRVFEQFACLEVGSRTMTLSHPAYQ